MSILGRIGELRKRHEKLSINKLEQECGLTRGSMAKWDDHAPSPDKVKKVADYFNVSVEYLLYGDPSAGIKKERPADGEARVCDLPESIQKIINICLDRPELASASRRISPPSSGGNLHLACGAIAPPPYFIAFASFLRRSSPYL